jgi:hypothetical protein
MAKLNVVALPPPMRGEQISDEATMTFLGARLRTKQHRTPRPNAPVKSLRDFATSHQIQESDFVSRPILGVAVGIEQFGCRREPRFVGIANASDPFQEICEVRVLGKPGELASAVQAHIDERFHFRLLEKEEKFFGGLSRETDRT